MFNLIRFFLIVITRYRLNTTKCVIKEPEKHQKVPKFNKKNPNLPIGGIWLGLTPYRLPIDTLSEYPEPWFQQTRGILSLSSPNISGLKKTESQTWGEML